MILSHYYRWYAANDSPGAGAEIQRWRPHQPYHILEGMHLWTIINEDDHTILLSMKSRFFPFVLAESFKKSSLFKITIYCDKKCKYKGLLIWFTLIVNSSIEASEYYEERRCFERKKHSWDFRCNLPPPASIVMVMGNHTAAQIKRNKIKARMFASLAVFFFLGGGSVFSQSVHSYSKHWDWNNDIQKPLSYGGRYRGLCDASRLIKLTKII